MLRSSLSMNAVLCDTRAACCILWVTMMMEYSWLNSCISCSMARVAMGSRAEHGSSIRMTLGSTASARAMQRRCC